MNAYLPTSSRVLVELASLELATLVLGFAITRSVARFSRVAAWSLVVAGVALAHLVTIEEGAGLRMLAICAVTLTTMKIVVAFEARATEGTVLTFDRWLLFTSWPGMRPKIFAVARSPQPGAVALIVKGLVRVAIGALLFLAARLAWTETHSHVLATVLLLPALSLLFHFGAFNVGAGIYRALGFACEPLFIAPLYAKSLDEFWSKRWNLAFSDMARLGVYRPLSPRLGKSNAALAAFLFSGVLHEIAISLPAKAGFGLPLLYFALHGALITFERRLAKRGRPISERGALAHVWTLAFLALPMPILFHPPFLASVVWPMLG